MVYNEKAIFKRDIKLRGNNKVTQIRVSGLSVNSKFKDNEEIIILSKDDFTQLENQLNTKEETIQELEKELRIVREKNTESPKYINKVLELQILINNRNNLLMETQNTINTIIREITKQYNELSTEVTDSNTETKENIITLISELQNIISTVLDYCNEMEKQVNGINSTIDKTSWFKWIRSKNKFKIIIDTDKLKELECKLREFNTVNVISRANEVFTPIEIPVNILEELTTEGLDLTNLYIGIVENDTNEIIPSKVITSDKK